MTRVLLVDDHPSTRIGLRALLESEGFEVAAEAGSADEAVAAAAAVTPDLVILDVRMANGDGVTAIDPIREAAGPDTRVVCLSAFDDVPLVDAALRAGADGYLVKGMAPDELLDALRRAMQGEVVVPDEVAARLEPFGHHRVGFSLVPPLSDRELAVLRLASRGLTNVEIGENLYVSESSVKLHLRRATEKLDAPDRTAAVAAALRLGLIE